MPRNFTLKVKREVDFQKLSKARDFLEQSGIVGHPFAKFLDDLLSAVIFDGPPDPYEVKKLLRDYIRDFVDDLKTIRSFVESHPTWVKALLKEEADLGFCPIELIQDLIPETQKIELIIEPRTKEAPRSANQDAPSAFQKTTSIAGYHGPTMNGGGSGRPLVS